MARGFLEFRERKGLGRSPFKKKTSRMRGCTIVDFVTSMRGVPSY